MLQTVRYCFGYTPAGAVRAGVMLGAPPNGPTGCGGRGGDGCVWEGFYAAAAWWQEDAQALLPAQPAPPQQP